MSNLILRYPDLERPYSEAMRLAVDFILERFDPIGIIAAGSVVRGCGHATSDLDFYVITDGELSQRVSKYFSGVPAEIFANPPLAVRAHFAREQAARRPIAAHMLATGFVVLNRSEAVDRLREEAARLLLSPPEVHAEALTSCRYLAGNEYEDAVDIAEIDPAAACIHLVHSVHDMLRYVILKHGCFYPRAKDLVSSVEKLDPDAAALTRSFCKPAGLAEKLKLAGKLADRTIRTRGFFEWESTPAKLY